MRDALLKVYADKGLRFDVDCPPGLSWRIDEGDAFEIGPGAGLVLWHVRSSSCGLRG